VDLLPETVAHLAGRPGIVGIKEARPELDRMRALLALKTAAPDFAVLSGDDGSAAGSLLAGADGLISVANNIAPRALRQLCDLARANRSDEAHALDARLQPLFDAIGLESNPIPVKWGLSVLGICEPHLRLPLTCLSEGHRDRLRLVVDGADRMAA
jgi:4-hydroxy-tetrahydrodipicolinate synthase